MIPTTAQLEVEHSKIAWQQQEKNRWLKTRDKAYDYYKGRTELYTKDFFSDSLIKQIPIPNINLTKRVIDRISLVYMKPPIREYSTEENEAKKNIIFELTHGKDFKMQRAEKLTNLLEVVLMKVCWRDEKLEYDIIRDWEPIFGDDPLHPVAITYPLKVRNTVYDTTPEMWAYWDDENHFIYEKATKKKIAVEGNDGMINPYGMMPFVECYREGRPESSYFDTDASPSLIATNEAVNVAEFNKNANIMFQSFGFGFITGSNIEKSQIEIGQDKWSFLGHDGSLSMVAPPNSVPALTDSIKESYKMLAQNYHLSVAFVEGSTAESGIALRMRNQELMDSRRHDVERWRELEKKLFEIEKRIIMIELQKSDNSLGELVKVDFDESTEILSEQEQRDKWDWELANGLIDSADILMQQDPDKYPDRESALEYLSERGGQVQDTGEEAGATSPLLQALTAPV